MRSIAHIANRFHIMATDTPKERVRASIAMTHAAAIAERLLQADKGNPEFRLADLRDEDERSIYIDAAAAWLLDQAGRLERTNLLNKTRSHGFALVEMAQRDVERQAQQDIARYGDRFLQAFLTTNPRHCALCREPLITNAVDVFLTESIKGRAHGLCCAKNETRFEFVNEFTYRLIGGAL